jgi:hypothetical protein
MKLIKNKIIKIYINLKYSFISDSEDEQYLWYYFKLLVRKHINKKFKFFF